MILARDGIASCLYLILLVGATIWLRRTGQKNKISKILLGTGIFLLIYGLYLVISYSLLFDDLRRYMLCCLIPVGFFGLFLLLYHYDKCRLRNGWLFNLFLVSLIGFLLMLAFLTNSYLLLAFFLLLAVVAFLILAFGIYALVIFLIGNSYFVLKRESHSLANLLTLFLAISIIGILVIQYVGTRFLPNWAVVLLAIPAFILSYFFLSFWNFLSISFIYQLNRPHLNQDYIIVLGAGLLAGERVSPLLAKRIDRAIAFYEHQQQKTQIAPILLMSGGKGSDEKISEAEAMKNYALTKGIPANAILTETHSTNTLENMRFSKEIIEKEQSVGYHAIFVSNNYHIFRAGIYARQVGLRADGIGAKTASYYLPNAFLREFVAVLLMKKWLHLIMCGLIVLLLVSLAAAQFFY